MSEIISLVIGSVLFVVSYLLGKELDGKSFQKDVELRDFDFSRIGIFRQVYALFFPYAYFEPWKVREVYPVLFMRLVSFFLGIYFIFHGLNSLTPQI